MKNQFTGVVIWLWTATFCVFFCAIIWELLAMSGFLHLVLMFAIY